jgi:hypothetical protein
MSRFRVSVTKLAPIPAVLNGELGMCASFRIEPLNGGSVHHWEGNAGGKDFIYRCERLKLQAVTVEAPEPTSTIETWKEEMVHRALAQVAL